MRNRRTQSDAVWQSVLMFLVELYGLSATSTSSTGSRRDLRNKNFSKLF